jgi:O-antigen/teichoic acid export membrane protein
MRGPVSEIAHAGHALIALYALTNIDVLLARAQLSEHDAGLYAAGQLVARAVFFLPSAILVAAFPRMVTQGGGRAQRQATAAVAALGLLGTLFTALAPGLVLAVVAGSQYVAVTGSLWIFALAGAGFGVVQVLLYARLAQHDRRVAIVMWSATLVLIGLGVTVGKQGVPAMASCAATIAWAVALVGLVLDARTRTQQAA